jgi:ubiquinone/menaquinone biosynthesis C-methylase UbiE
VARGRRVFAAVYDRLSRLAETRGGMAERREELLAHTYGRVLEIGSGTGLNFAHYPKAVSDVVAVEPDPHMLKRSRVAAARAPVPVRLEQAGAEEIPLPDAWADFAVTTLVLCTIPDQDLALTEVLRILKPGGRMVFLEHVRADTPRLARWQDRLERPWSILGGGCHPNRDTVAAFEEAGFAIESVHSFDMPGLPILRPHAMGVAVKPGTLRGVTGGA